MIKAVSLPCRALETVPKPNTVGSADLDAPICTLGRPMGQRDRPGPGDLWHPFDAPDESDADLPANRQPTSHSASARSHQIGEHGPLSWDRSRGCSGTCRANRNLKSNEECPMAKGHSPARHDPKRPPGIEVDRPSGQHILHLQNGGDPLWRLQRNDQAGAKSARAVVTSHAQMPPRSPDQRAGRAPLLLLDHCARR
jgi:hypothetical protein